MTQLTYTVIFDSKPAPLMAALEGILDAKGLPFIHENGRTLTLPDDGLTIQLKPHQGGQTAVCFTPITADNELLAHRVSTQLGEIFTDVTAKATRKKRRNWVLVGCGTAVLLCLAAFIALALRLYHAVKPPPLVWNYAAQGTVFSRPIIAGDAIYFGTLGYEDSRFFALNLADGSERWQVSYGDAHGGNIFYWPDALTSNNLVLFTTEAGYFYALDALTGEEAWAFGPEQRGVDNGPDCDRCALKFSQPLLVNDVVYLPSLDHHLYALDATTGEELWRFSGDNSFLGPPSVIEDRVYAGNMDRSIYILDAHTGQEQGCIVANRSVYEVLSDGELIYAVLEGGRLQAFAIDSGDPVWQFDGGGLGGFSGRMVLHDDKVLVMSSERVFAVNRQTGALAWDFAGMQRGVYSDFTLVDGRFYVGDGDSFLYILDADNGDLMERFSMKSYHLINRAFVSESLFTPAVHEGKAYFGLYGELYAVEIDG
jgi:outer membrane protein assembly factor BamB